jgi:MFS family permease
MLIPVGFIVGAPIYGRLTDRFLRNKVNVLIQVVAIQAGLWGFLVYGGGFIGKSGMVPILLAFGATAGGFATALWGLVRETTAESVLGLVSGMLNPAPFLGVAAMQTMTGALMDRVGRVAGNYPPEAYADAFTACLLVMLGCLLLCAGLRKRLYRPI